MKSINIEFDDEEFAKLKDKKRELCFNEKRDISWKNIVIKGLQ